MMPSPILGASRPAADSTPPARGRRFAWVAAGLLLGLMYLVLIGRNSVSLPTDSDSSGYLNIAQRIQRGQLVDRVPSIAGLAAPDWDPYVQQPLGYRVSTPDGRRVTTYPVGYPLHLLAAAPLVGLDHANVVVSLFLVVAAAGLMLGLGREIGLPWLWSAAGAALLLACPLFILCVLQPMSDVAATVWSMAVIWLAWCSHRRPACGFAAGAALAVAVLVRPSDLLLVLPVAIILGGDARAWLRLIVGGLPGAAFQAWYNHTLYGSILTTGYGDVSNLFGLRYVPHNGFHFIWWVSALLTPVVLAGALALPWVGRDARRTAWTLLVWVAAFVGFYLFYFHSGEFWWYLRFILPVFPALILAALSTAHTVTSRWRTNPRWLRLGAAGALAVALAWQASLTHQLGILYTKGSSRPYIQTVAWMHAHVPADSIVVQMQLSGCFAFYTGYTIVRWDLITPDAWSALQRAALDARRPIYATLYDFEEERALRQNVPGSWRLVTRVGGRVSVWALAPTAPPNGSG